MNPSRTVPRSPVATPSLLMIAVIWPMLAYTLLPHSALPQI